MLMKLQNVFRGFASGFEQTADVEEHGAGAMDDDSHKSLLFLILNLAWRLSFTFTPDSAAISGWLVSLLLGCILPFNGRMRG